MTAPLASKVTPPGRSAAEILAWSRALTDVYLREEVLQLPERLCLIAGYHFGWWDEEQNRTPGTSSGKAIRPALTLLSARAVGGDATVAVPAAVAVELVHNFSLLHDDIMDHDPVRRHRPTAWTIFGVADAILTGDALLSLASCCVSVHGFAFVDALNRCVIELCQGQSSDLAFEQRDEVSLAECWAMAEAKTAVLLGCACELGASAGAADARRTEMLRDFGRHLGLAFQLVDDLLGIWGDPAVTGKPVHSDLANRKRSLPVVAAMSSATEAGRQLGELYRQREPLEPERLQWAADLVEQAGGRRWAQSKAEEEIHTAMECLAAADCRPEVSDELRALARMITFRDH